MLTKIPVGTVTVVGLNLDHNQSSKSAFIKPNPFKGTLYFPVKEP